MNQRGNISELHNTVPRRTQKSQKLPMTRVTNFGRKRTYLQAGLEGGSAEVTTSNAVTTSAIEDTEGTTAAVDISTSDSGPPKKKKKRIRKKKPQPKDAEGSAGGQSDRETEAQEGKKEPSLPTKKSLKKKRWKEQEKEKKQRRLISSETRRQKRIDERFSGTICFACREIGHAARDCPTVKNGRSADDKVKNGRVIGICYRCGSTRHTLSKCKANVDDSNPLPFASCFVCNGQGHLASSCPQNKEKGIYPNGGACKLCGEKTHLAKDCRLRKRDNVDTLAVMGTSDQPGADEDDFHTFRRRRQEVEKETVNQEKETRLQAKLGPGSGTVEPLGNAPKPVKKVVFF